MLQVITIAEGWLEKTAGVLVLQTVDSQFPRMALGYRRRGVWNLCVDLYRPQDEHAIL